MKSFTKTILGLLLLVCIIGTIPSTLASGENWLNGWSDRKGITITGSSGAGTDYQVYLYVSYESEMQADFDDLRFTDDDGATLLNYWLEYKIDSNYADVWVKVTDDLNSTQIIYMYYGNAGVSTTSSGVDTFIFFDDFELNDLSRWSDAGADWSTTATQAAMGTYSAYGDSGGDYRGLIQELASKIQYSIMVHAHVRFQGIIGEEYPIMCYEEDTTLIYALYTENDEWGTYDGVDVKYYEEDTQTADTWFRFEVGFDWIGEEFYPYLDRVLKTKQDMDSSDASAVVTDVKRVGSSTAAAAGADHWIDDYYVRKWIVSEPVALFGLWDAVNTAQFIFPIGWDPIAQFGYNAFFIFLGLIMIPASTLYLVRGGRKEMNSDKLFYALILFFVGCGLFIGGILPP